DKEGLVIQDIRNHSIRSLGWIQCQGDNDAQSQLCKLGYAGMMAVSVGICGGCQVVNDKENKSTLSSIGCFFNRIHEERFNFEEDIDDSISSSQITILCMHSEEQFEEEGGNDDYISIPPQPELAKPSEEQFEEEGGNDDYISFPPQPELTKPSEEQFEEEGGNDDYISIPPQPELAKPSEEQFEEEGGNDDHISFPPQPELTKPSEEQFEEEGGNEEIEALLINKGRKKFDNDSINVRAIRAKYAILNSFYNKLNVYQKRYTEHEYYYDDDRIQVSRLNVENDDDDDDEM
ncbi:MAG: hypothetical protein EZS28_009617, partial [Streblomastix strix]